MTTRTRRLLIGIATVVTAYIYSGGALATGTGKSFTTLAPGFTQDLYGVTGDFADPEFGILGGVAFAPSAGPGQVGDVWSSECYFYGTRLHRFAKDVTETQHGTLVHHDSVVDVSEMSPYSSVLPYGAGGCGLVNHPDGFMYSNSMWGVWKLDPATGAPIDPSTNQPVDPYGTSTADENHPAGTLMVGGASAQGGNALGIAVDPATWAGDPARHLVYVGADCHPSLSPTSTTCTLFDLNPATGVTQVFARMSRPELAFFDGIYFSPAGDYLFAAYRDEAFEAPQNALYIFRRPTALGALNAAVDDTQVVRKVMMTSEPDGVAFHATQNFVVTLNESDDGPTTAGTMTRFDFGNGFANAPTGVSVFASGGFRGDLLQVGVDGCIYATQGRLFDRDPNRDAARYDDSTVDEKNSVVRICGGFAAAPGASGNNETATGTISGVVYVDENRNQQFDAGEQVLPNVTVTLNGPNGTETTTSGPDGSYTFGSLPAGGFSVSSPDEAHGLQLFTESPITFTLAPNEQKTGVDFGYVPGSVSGYAYVDSNRNMVFDQGEAVIPNVTITLSTGTGTPMTTETGPDGKYVFGYVPAGTYDDSAPAVADGKALFTPSPLVVTVAAGQDTPNHNFGYVPGSITGTVFTDTNGNGTQDGNEPGIPGVPVTGPNGQTTTTDSNGDYTFPDVPPGTYTITTPVTPPTTVTVTPGGTTTGVDLGHPVGSLSGFAYVDANRNSVKDATEAGIGGVTITGPAGATTTAGDGSYSFVNLETGTYSVSSPPTAAGKARFTANPLSVAVTAGQNSPNNNFGYVPGSLSGFAYFDANRNSVKDAGEVGIPGVTITGPGGATTVTSVVDGSYSFANLDAGTYNVSAPAGAAGKKLNTPSPLSVTVAAGASSPNNNFGYVVGSISGYVYVDTNFNMVRDAGETGIGGVTVTLSGLTTTTAADGSYSFTNLIGAFYSVSSPATAGSYTLETPSPLSVTLAAGEIRQNVNFGYVPAGAMVTYTQGGWGAAPNGNNPGMLLKNNFATVYPNGVTIGGSPYYLKFTSAAAIEAFLPAGGKPGVLKASATNPLTSAANVFAGQVLAMQLSVDFSARGITTAGLGGMHIAPGRPLAGYTVNQVMAIANQVIAGNLSALPAGMTVANLNDLVTAMTQNFDNGTTNNGVIVQ